MKFGYRKIFLGDKAAQEQVLEPVDQIFEDRILGSRSTRPELEELIKFASEGDQVIAQSMDCLGKDVRDLYRIIAALWEKGTSIHFVREDMNFEPTKVNTGGKSSMDLLQSLADFEHMIIKRRQKEGIYRAKKMKKYKGRKATLNPDLIREEFSRTGKVSLTAKNLGISRMSVYRLIRGKNV